jgi:hypothetical protein
MEAGRHAFCVHQQLHRLGRNSAGEWIGVHQWTGKDGKAKLINTTLTLTSITGVAAGANGNAGFTFSHQATSGSFAGSISGELNSNQSANMPAGPSGCGAKKGMKKINIVSGSASQP